MTPGFTLSSVLHHQNSLLPETFGPGACFNGCFVYLRAVNLVFGCFCDALDMLGRVASPACKMDGAASPSAAGLLERTASGSPGPTVQQDALCPMAGTHFSWSLGQFWMGNGKDGNVLVWKCCCDTFHKTHAHILPRAVPSLGTEFAGSFISPNPWLPANKSFASP